MEESGQRAGNGWEPGTPGESQTESRLKVLVKKRGYQDSYDGYVPSQEHHYKQKGV